MFKRSVIVGYGRSPFTPAFKGELAMVRPDEILAQVMRGVILKSGIEQYNIEDVIIGCAFPEAEQGLNIARLASFLAQIPLQAGGTTVNRFCGSSMEAIHIAAGKIAIGAGDLFICGGIESMTRIPMTGFNPLPHPALFENYPQAYEGMGITAENVADKYYVSRKAQEEFAMASHMKAHDAFKAGRLNDEIISIKDADELIKQDGCIRPDTNLESLSRLEPAFLKTGVVTAGTSSPLTDGASVVIVCSEEYANIHKLNKIAYIKSTAVSGCAPEIMGMGPVGASQKALERVGLTIDDMDIVELNEAFAAQALAVIQELKIDLKKVNLDGGAIAIGHPLGASGARIVGKAASLLQKHHKKYALATMCIGGGQGIATILEAV